MRFVRILITISAVSAFSSHDVGAQTIGCDDFYTVEKGDTLQDIAKRAYGRSSAYQILYSANQDKVGRNPGIIQIGARFWVPCRDGQKQAGADLPAIRKQRSGAPQIKLLTGSDFAPFTDRALENGGLITELVHRSLQTADPDLEYRIDFVNDWASHLQPLISDGAYDVGFPWYKPDCSKLDRLGRASKWRCENLYFSDPFHEAVVSYFGMWEKRHRFVRPADLRGKTLCRPSGYFTFDLEVRELVPPHVTLVQPHSINDCFDRLVAGSVDVVTINVDTADAAIKALNLSGKVVEYQALATIETLHAVVSNTHPRARSLLLRLNRGLKALQQSGAYRKIVTRHLARFVK